MDRHQQITLAVLLWALVVIALCGVLQSLPDRNQFTGETLRPAGRLLALWTWALALLFLAAVGLTAWVAQ
jgi:hypothetical protein